MTRDLHSTNRHSIDIAGKFCRIDENWAPRIIAEMNDVQFKIVQMEGEFIWHSHPETDEAFIVLDGQLKIEFRDGQVTLQNGQMYVVPRGVEHRTTADSGEAKVMLVEPRGTVNTGDAGGERTRRSDDWA